MNKIETVDEKLTPEIVNYIDEVGKKTMQRVNSVEWIPFSPRGFRKRRFGLFRRRRGG